MCRLGYAGGVAATALVNRSAWIWYALRSAGEAPAVLSEAARSAMMSSTIWAARGQWLVNVS